VRDIKVDAPLLASMWNNQVSPQQMPAVTDHSTRRVLALKPSQGVRN
jgi:hypothetical protein